MSLEAILERLGGERRIHYALDRFEACLKHVGNPQECVKSLIVAGTNGKGTTALFLSGVLNEAGYRVGTYLSPHLQSVSERFAENLVPADIAELDALAAEFEPVADKFELTYFEFLTLIYFVWAKRKHFDFNVLEVGLGGKLDATNVTDAVACAIPTIDFDHESYLGDTLEAILSEKLGVLRPESLLFTGVRDPDLIQKIEHRCMELDAIYYYSKDLALKTKKVSWEGRELTVNGFPMELSNPSTGTMENAALAQMLMRIVFPKISSEEIRRGIAKVVTPGRMEVVQEVPRVVLSGDHNPAGVQCLLATLDNLQAGKVRVVCGFSPDKPYRQMFEMLQGAASEIVLTEIPRLRGKMPVDYTTLGDFEPDPFRAVEKMLERTGKEETLLVTGSLYLVGEVRKLWKNCLSSYRKTP